MNMLHQTEDERSEPLTGQKVLQLLEAPNINPFIRSEEQRHPWSVNIFQRFHSPLLRSPLLRVWDYYSGSQPEEDNGMLSRSPNEPLGTEQARQTSLARHLDHRIWEPTPYISFTKSARAIEELAEDRRINRGRGEQTLTVIDPAVRLRNGLPILDVVAEMEYYGIQDPYNRGSRYYVNHYVCLWEVTEEEIIGHYDWEELANTTNWYEEIVMPAFRESSRRKPNSVPTHTSVFDMLTIMESSSGEDVVGG